VADGGGRAEVVSRLFHPAIDFGLTNTVLLYRRLFHKGVALRPHHDLRSIGRGVVTLYNRHDGVERTVEGLDMVIVMTPPVPKHGLVSELKSAGSELQVIGACVAPRDIETAIFEGHCAAVAI